MATKITQIEDAERGQVVLRVEGELFHEDAILLEKIALEMRDELGKKITIDLADLDMMDSDSAPILKRIEQEHGFTIEGIPYFLQKVVDETER
jgi:anti-anti-sigma regulatory factor